MTIFGISVQVDWKSWAFPLLIEWWGGLYVQIGPVHFWRMR